MRSFSHTAIATILLAGTTVAGAAVPLPYAGMTTTYGYAALADMALAAPVVLAADVTSAIPLKGTAAADVPAGTTRFYVQAVVRALIGGRADVPPNVTYLADVPNDARGRAPKLKGVPVLLLAAQTTQPGALRLIGPHAQLPRTPEIEGTVRAILAAKLAPDAPPAITGISRAFHVPGSLPGESETQIFLKTADARPISLSVLRRPGEAPRWAVALTEMVDDSAAPPARDTLLWYRLACGLPAALPPETLAGLSDADATATSEDYAVVLGGLGRCA